MKSYFLHDIITIDSFEVFRLYEEPSYLPILTNEIKHNLH